MSGTPEFLLWNQSNDSLGAPFTNVSPYLIDLNTVLIIAVLYRCGLNGGSIAVMAPGLLFAALMAVWGGVAGAGNLSLYRRYPEVEATKYRAGFC